MSDELIAQGMREPVGSLPRKLAELAKRYRWAHGHALKIWQDLGQQHYELHQQLEKLTSGDIDSEKDMNHILTEENELLERKLELAVNLMSRDIRAMYEERVEKGEYF